jgi:Zn finger protein HypA/HybF involved in hydrogenase expression
MSDTEITCQCCTCEIIFFKEDTVDKNCPRCGSGDWVIGYIDQPITKKDKEIGTYNA